MSRAKVINYNPTLSIKENAKRNGVSEPTIRNYIKENKIDRRFDRKQNVIADCRKLYKKNPDITRNEIQKKTGHSLSTIRKYWKYISTEEELIDFDKEKAKKRQLRQFNNFYATHPSVTQDILREERFNEHILEPFCGTGTMAKVITQNGYDVDAYDIIDRGYGKVSDFFRLNVPDRQYDIITNPPYDDNLTLYIRKCLNVAKEKVALLLPLNYLSGEHRAQDIFFQKPPCRVYVYTGRISIGKNGDFAQQLGNKINYAWYVWERGYKGSTELKWLKNEAIKVQSFSSDNLLLGAIAGDMIGKPYERRDRAIKTKDFPLFEKRSKYTDDTVLTIAVMDWLLSDKEHTWEVLAEKFVHYGTRYRIKGQDRCFSEEMAKWLFDEHREFGKQSKGNGAAMRVSPVGWFFDTVEEVERVAIIQAALTHNTQEGKLGAAIAAVAVFLARTRKTKEEIKDFLWERYSLLLSDDFNTYRETYTWTSLCLDTVKGALMSFLCSTDFEDAIRNAVSLGGDADTIGAITGSIAEAYYGEVPEHIRNEVLRRAIPEEFKEILTKFSAEIGR